MSFKDQSFGDRFKAMGDEAERAFEDAWDGGWTRYGLARPRISMAKLPPFVRYTPDYLTSGSLVEAQGLGRDQTFKLKVDKHAALLMWNHLMPTLMFVWDTTNRRYITFPITDLDLRGADVGAFPEGKAYYAVHVDHLPGEWVNVQ